MGVAVAAVPCPVATTPAPPIGFQSERGFAVGLGLGEDCHGGRGKLAPQHSLGCWLLAASEGEEFHARQTLI